MMAIRLASWPAPPHQNAVIETASGMFTDLEAMARRGKPTRLTTPFEMLGLYVIHWPDGIFWRSGSNTRLWLRIMIVLGNLSFLKAHGVRLLWFVHNLQRHDLAQDRLRMWNFYAERLAYLVDGWLTLSQSTGALAKARYPALAERPHSFIWHPPYVNSYCGTRTQARAELGLPDEQLVFGHVGILRPYKHLGRLASRFETIAPEGARLLLMGKAKDGVEHELGVIDDTKRDLDFREGPLSAIEFDRALCGLDVFVAPYAQFLHSGAIVHALSRGCVVVAPRVPFTEDLERELGEWVVLYDGDPSEEDMLKAARTAQAHEERAPNLTGLEPSQNIQRLRALLCQLGLDVPDETLGAGRGSG